MNDVNNVEQEVLTKAYNLVNEFLTALNQSDFELLKSKFGITEAVYEEIQILALDEFFRNLGKEINLSPPPLDIAFIDQGPRIPFDVFGGENESECWGIECQLWNSGKKAEPIAHFDLFKEGDTFRLQYRYIGS